jgi:hypothetical protein
MNNIKFNKKTIHIPKDFKELEADISILLDKNEEAIKQYISRYIYTSNISEETNLQLNEIFKHVRSSII